jgi:hypothetical protein
MDGDKDDKSFFREGQEEIEESEEEVEAIIFFCQHGHVPKRKMQKPLPHEPLPHAPNTPVSAPELEASAGAEVRTRRIRANLVPLDPFGL